MKNVGILFVDGGELTRNINTDIRCPLCDKCYKRE